jgi:hypothetical protein
VSSAPAVKVYGHIYPASDALFMELVRLCAPMADGADPTVTCEGSVVSIAFEGTHFPVDEALEAVSRHLTPAQRGKLDVLDMEGWRLTRHVFADGRVTSSAAPLNDVLAYSGF